MNDDLSQPLPEAMLSLRWEIVTLWAATRPTQKLSTWISRNIRKRANLHSLSEEELLSAKRKLSLDNAEGC